MGRVAVSMAPREPDAFVTGLYSAYDAELRKALVRMLGSEADAADIAQEAYLKLYRLARPEDIEYPRALLFQTATNLAVDLLRRRRRAAAVVPMSSEADRVPDRSPPLERQSVAHDAMQKLSEIVRELPERRRQVFEMQRFKDMTAPEIAAELNISLSMVEQHLSRALTHCRERLKEVGLD